MSTPSFSVYNIYLCAVEQFRFIGTNICAIERVPYYRGGTIKMYVVSTGVHCMIDTQSTNCMGFTPRDVLTTIDLHSSSGTHLAVLALIKQRRNTRFFIVVPRMDIIVRCQYSQSFTLSNLFMFNMKASRCQPTVIVQYQYRVIISEVEHIIQYKNTQLFYN